MAKVIRTAISLKWILYSNYSVGKRGITMAKPSMKCVSCDKVITHKDPKQRKGLCYDCWFLETEKSWGGC